jgi:dipeptidyl aminopeptidase/acylaminoacyl peptidase
LTRGRAVWIVPADAGEPRQLDLPYLNVMHISWSPDATRLAVTATAEESFDKDVSRLYIVGVREPSVVLVQAAETAVWSRDGRFLAIQHTASLTGRSTIDVVNADGSGRRTIAENEGFRGFDWLAWLP